MEHLWPYLIERERQRWREREGAEPTAGELADYFVALKLYEVADAVLAEAAA